jgi:hypothetical protein
MVSTDAAAVDPMGADPSDGVHTLARKEWAPEAGTAQLEAIGMSNLSLPAVALPRATEPITALRFPQEYLLKTPRSNGEVGHAG